MKIIAASIAALTISGCALIPSFWDDNQASMIVNVRQLVDAMDCSQPHAPQVRMIQSSLRWFELYSESKGSRQQDVLQLIEPMQRTVDDFYKRSTTNPGSEAYCNLKKKTMAEQSKTIAEAVLGRF